MSLRTWLSLATLVLVGGVSAYLLTNEKITQGDQTPDFQARQTDPMVEMAFTAASRKRNFEQFGLDEEMVKAALDLARRYEDTGKVDRLRLLMDNASAPTDLAEAICGRSPQIRPRYGALRFFVALVQGERRPIDIDRVSTLQWEPWSKAAPIATVYDQAELAEDRKPDATLMAIAAILTAQEQELLNGYKPWGRGLAATWSWKQVKQKFPGIEKRCLDYFVIMHLAVELANAEGGICD